MWDPAKDGPFEGKHYQLAETVCRPLPISKLPILVGGGGERKTLRLVAEYADACNLFATSRAEVARKLDILRRHCDDVGRDESTIQKTIMVTAGRRTSTCSCGEMVDYARLGVDTVMVLPPGDAPAAWIDRLGAPIAARLAELSCLVHRLTRAQCSGTAPRRSSAAVGERASMTVRCREGDASRATSEKPVSRRSR